MKLRYGKEERYLVIALAVVAAYFSLVTFVPFIHRLLERLWDWLITLNAAQGYLGGFLASFLANFSIVIPIPYTVVIVLLGAGGLNPFILGVVAGIGAALGESSSYVLGAFGHRLTKDIYRRNLEVLRRLVENRRGYVWLILFIIGVTPVPDDIFIVPLGFMRFGFRRIFIPITLGKMVITIFLAYFGRYSSLATVLLGTSSSNLLTNSLTLAGSVVAVYLMFKVNWEAVGDRLVGRRPAGIGSRGGGWSA